MRSQGLSAAASRRLRHPNARVTSGTQAIAPDRYQVESALSGKIARAHHELARGLGIGKVARMTGLGTGTVHKLKREMAASERHLPSSWTTASHRARVSAFAGSLGFCRTAVCTIMSFEPGSTNINWPWSPLSTNIRREPD